MSSSLIGVWVINGGDSVWRDGCGWWFLGGDRWCSVCFLVVNELKLVVVMLKMGVGTLVENCE